MTIRVLVSVRSVAEAKLVATGGAQFIDLKEPGQGALGGLPLAMIGSIVTALRARHPGLVISATIGDVPMVALADILARVLAVAGCGVDLVKVGIETGPQAGAPAGQAQAGAVLDALAGCGHAVVPVFIADHGIDAARWQQALALPLAGVMIDTADKHAGSLFEVMSSPDLAALLAQARLAGRLCGLAGALRLPHLARLRALAPDFAGFRSAVCDGHRSGALVPARLAALVLALRGDAADAAPAAHGQAHGQPNDQAHDQANGQPNGQATDQATDQANDQATAAPPGLLPAPWPPARPSPISSDRIAARSAL